MNKISEKMNFNLFGEKVEKTPLLRDKFIEPPFSVLDTKGANWQKRKKQWKTLGIRSEIGRDAKAYNMSDWLDTKAKKGQTNLSDTSIFDPALCEVLYHWFCEKNGSILDPFAGGSVRGIVAHYLNYKYTGIELRPEQVHSNRIQAKDILNPNNQPKWIIGDSNKVLEDLTKKSFNNELTPCQEISKNVWVKREDYAGFISEEQSSGTKVRAFNKMIKAQPEKNVLAVGCSADSLMQVYIAEMAKNYKMKSKIFIPQRKKRTNLTEYCYSLGANIEEISYPCYPVHYRNHLKDYAKNNNCVLWNPLISTEDTALQVSNIPKEAKRIIVSCGSGAIAIGIMLGLIMYKRTDIELIAVKVSNAFGGKKELLIKLEKILKEKNIITDNLPELTIINPTSDYSKKQVEFLPDGTELDYTYSAKAFKWMKDNPQDFDVLWISGRRPKLKINIVNQDLAKSKDIEKYDFVFSCPPYADLEVYSDLEGDISNMPYNEFLTAYNSIIEKSCKLLKTGCYACFVVGEVRNKQGNYISFVPDTIKAFTDCGMKYYNEAILLTSIASAAMRASGNMKNKKLVKIHQNILIFKKI